MPDVDQSDETSSEPRHGALVPFVPSLRWLPPHAASGPDSTFVTHMMADAGQTTPGGIRAARADARSAYAPGPQERRGVARRTRQII